MNNLDLRMRMKEVGVTQKQLAQYFKVTETTVSRWFKKELCQADRMKILQAVRGIALPSDQIKEGLPQVSKRGRKPKGVSK